MIDELCLSMVSLVEWNFCSWSFFGASKKDDPCFVSKNDKSTSYLLGGFPEVLLKDQALNF